MEKAAESHTVADEAFRSSDLVFFLGGSDLEMETIRRLLEEHAPERFCDKGLSWGAKASDYRGEIAEALERGLCPVLVELDLDIDVNRDRVIIVDHHGRRAGSEKESSLEQVFHLLELPDERWTRWRQLVAANDRGAIDALRKAGASEEEIVEIRNRDRRAQGVTPEEEKAAREAVSQAEWVAKGTLALVRLPHDRTSPVGDFLDPAFGGPGYENLLVVSPGEVNFYGAGEIIGRLDEAFPGGWKGGSLPERGFWGRAASRQEADTIIKTTLKIANNFV